MSKLPKVIYVEGQEEIWIIDHGTWHECELIDSGETEYVRRDLVDELIEAVDSNTKEYDRRNGLAASLLKSKRIKEAIESIRGNEQS